MDVITIIGYVLFALSELLSLLPTNTNGFLDTLRLGLRNSISDRNGNPDIEMAQNILRSKPEVAKMINDITTNPKLTSTVNRILGNLHIVQFVNTLTKNPQVQYIFTLFKTHPEIINDAKILIETHLLQKQSNGSIPQQVQQQQEQVQVPDYTQIQMPEMQQISDETI
jgi:hypothetical protein